MSEIDPYRDLGIDRTATPEQIRAAFRRAVRQRRPDTGTSASAGVDARRAIEAYHRRGNGGITDLSGPPARVLACRSCRGRGRVSSARRCDVCAGTGLATAPD